MSPEVPPATSPLPAVPQLVKVPQAWRCGDAARGPHAPETRTPRVQGAEEGQPPPSAWADPRGANA